MIIIVQVRMNSSRLPKKVLHRIYGKPLLEYLVSRIVAKIKYKLCIATSNHAQDNQIENICIKKNINYYRGSLNDVAKRMLDTAKSFDADAFVRINGDSPLIDPMIIKQGIKIYQSSDCDLITNTFPRSFPTGQSVEVIRTSTFEKIYKKMSQPAHFEHVTKYYYDNPDQFKIKNYKNKQNLSCHRMAVDTPEDLIRMKKIIGSMTKPHTEYSLDELIELYPAA